MNAPYDEPIDELRDEFRPRRTRDCYYGLCGEPDCATCGDIFHDGADPATEDEE